MTDAVITAGHGEETEAEAAERAIDEKTYGFWIYLMSDAIIFALLFATFVVMSHNTADGPDRAHVIPAPSHLCGNHAAAGKQRDLRFRQRCDRSRATLAHAAWLGVTFLLGLGFVAMEILEFYGMAVAGAGPWRSGFLSAFFTLVGTHGTHVSVGLVWIILLGCEVALRGLNPFVASRLYRLGLFWHFLVIVWIGIFSVVYLPGIL